MTLPLDRLRTALADRYRIERELGQRGMATVYLAEDIKHKRNVALKVLKPELVAVLGAERFVQELTTVDEDPNMERVLMRRCSGKWTRRTAERADAAVAPCRASSSSA